MEAAPVAAPVLIVVSGDEEDLEEVTHKKESQLISQIRRSRRQEKIWMITMVQRWRKKCKSKMMQLRK
jgi:hypothetical protein